MKSVDIVSDCLKGKSWKTDDWQRRTTTEASYDDKRLQNDSCTRNTQVKFCSFWFHVYDQIIFKWVSLTPPTSTDSTSFSWNDLLFIIMAEYENNEHWNHWHVTPMPLWTCKSPTHQTLNHSVTFLFSCFQFFKYKTGRHIKSSVGATRLNRWRECVRSLLKTFLQFDTS